MGQFCQAAPFTDFFSPRGFGGRFRRAQGQGRYFCSLKARKSLKRLIPDERIQGNPNQSDPPTMSDRGEAATDGDNPNGRPASCPDRGPRNRQSDFFRLRGFQPFEKSRSATLHSGKRRKMAAVGRPSTRVRQLRQALVPKSLKSLRQRQPARLTPPRASFAGWSTRSCTERSASCRGRRSGGCAAQRAPPRGNRTGSASVCPDRY
jgi:hypothetical protein